MITVLNGILICEKYVPKRKNNVLSNNPKEKRKINNKINYPYFEEHIDTSQLAYNLHQFKEGDLCYITLKIHGTSGRTSHTIQEKKHKFT